MQCFQNGNVGKLRGHLYWLLPTKLVRIECFHKFVCFLSFSSNIHTYITVKTTEMILFILQYLDDVLWNSNVDRRKNICLVVFIFSWGSVLMVCRIVLKTFILEHLRKINIRLNSEWYHISYLLLCWVTCSLHIFFCFFS